MSLRPAFGKEGTVTAGNASSVNDGAAALFDRIESSLRSTWQLEPLAKISWIYHVQPRSLNGSLQRRSEQSRQLNEKIGWTVDQTDLV